MIDIETLQKLAIIKANEQEKRGSTEWHALYYGYIFGFQEADKTEILKIVRWKCLLCGRDRFIRREPHKCNNTYRKHGIKWQPIYESVKVTEPKKNKRLEKRREKMISEHEYYNEENKNDSIFSNKRAKYCKDNELWKSCLYWRKKHRCIKACNYHKIDEEIF